MIDGQPSSFVTLISVIGCPDLPDSFRTSAELKLQEKNSKNKEMLEKYQAYRRKILNQN